MTFFDFFVLAVVGASVVSGAMRGLVRALVAGVALVAGLFLASQTYGAAGSLLQGAGIVESAEAASAAGFLLVAGLVLGAGFAAGSYVRSGLGRKRLGWLDRALGAAFGMARGVAVCSCIYLALTAFPVRLPPVTEAKTGPALAEGARILSLCTSTDVRARFQAEYRRLFTSDLSLSSGTDGK